MAIGPYLPIHSQMHGIDQRNAIIPKCVSELCVAKSLYRLAPTERQLMKVVIRRN